MGICEIHVSFRERESDSCKERDPARIQNAKAVAALMAPLLESEVVEVCYVVCLTTKSGPIGYCQVSRGTINETVVHPREIYQAALMANASSIVLVHNHPSGDPVPSPDDVAVTQRVKTAGDVMGIELLDHVIIGRSGRYASLRELGRL